MRYDIRQQSSAHRIEPRITIHTYGAGETMTGHLAHRPNGSRHMGLFINPDQTSSFLSAGVGRQPLRERHVCPNVNDDIPQQRCKEGRRQLRQHHARTLYRGKANSARCVVRPAAQDPADEHRSAVKEEGQGESKVLRMRRKVNVHVESSGCRPAAGTATSAAVGKATLKYTTGAPQGLGDGRRRTSAGTMRSAVPGDVRDNLEHWRNHYSRSTIGSLSYVTSPLDVITATDPTNAPFTSNTDPGRRKSSTFLAANGPSLSRQSRPRRRCWICGWECSHGSQEEAARVGDDGVLGIQNQPVALPPTGCTGVSRRPSAAAEGCWFCHAGEIVGEKPAGLGADCRDVMAAPIATVGGQVRSSGGRAPFDGRVDRPKVRDSHNGSAERRLEVSAGMQASTRSGVDDVGEKRDRREAQVTICAAEGLSGGSTKGRYQGAGEQQRSAGECRGNGGRLAGRGLSESLVDDGLATLRSGRHRRFQERGRHRQHGPIIRVATLKKDGFIEGTSNGDGANLGGREGGSGFEEEKRNSTKADDKMGRKSFPPSGPRGGSSLIREAACSGDEGSGGRNSSDPQAGGVFFCDPLCWEEGGVWWFRPRAYDTTRQPNCCSRRLA